MPDSPPVPDPELFDKVVNLSKRRGFVFQSAEIYGGFRSAYDYGPVGVLLQRPVPGARHAVWRRCRFALGQAHWSPSPALKASSWEA